MSPSIPGEWTGYLEAASNYNPKLEEATMGDTADLSKYPGYWLGSAKSEIDSKEIRLRRLEEKLLWLEREYAELSKQIAGRK